MVEKKTLTYIDWPLVSFLGIIVLVGLLNLYSATHNLPVAKFFQNQLIWVAFGAMVMLLATIIDYRWLEYITYPLYALNVGLLFLVLIAGTTVAGSTRWIRLGFFNFQPSETMKIVMILTLAKYFKQRSDQPPYNLIQLIVPLILLLVPMALIHKQPDLGTTIAVGVTGFSVVYFVGVERRTIIGIALSMLVLIPFAWFFLLSPYQHERVVTFMQPEKYALDGGYQVIQSKIAVGSGQLTGTGFLKGTQSKLNYLPKQYTDFIFANFAEEWGFLGCLFVLFCVLMFILSCLNVALRAKDRFGTLIAFGVTAYFFWNFLINIAMELGMLPVVGIPLPFMSYGGSSMLTCFVAMGLLFNVSLRRFMF